MVALASSAPANAQMATAPAGPVINQPVAAVLRQGSVEDRFTLSDVDGVARDFEAFVADAVARRRIVAAPVALPAPVAPDASWWLADVGASAGARSVALRDIIDEATRPSFQIGVFGALPAIRDTGVDEACGRFTPEAYAEVRRSDNQDRTTALSQTAGDLRLKEIDNSAEVGIRSRLRSGAQVTLSQRFSNLDTNNILYRPMNQIRSRTTISVIQPLLREAGTGYNTAIERIAGLEADSARLEFRRQAESHLLQIVRGYWTLYLARANHAQEARASGAVDDLAGRLDKRSGLDAQPLQVSRARAVGAERAAGLVRAANAVRNAEARLQSLVNDPALTAPADAPVLRAMIVDARALTETAMAQRPEVRTAFLSYRSALLREGMARNERMPQLDLVLEASTRGGNYNRNISPSFGDA